MKSKFLACLVLLPVLALTQTYKWKIQLESLVAAQNFINELKRLEL